jgi:hypothetical protein
MNFFEKDSESSDSIEGRQFIDTWVTISFSRGMLVREVCNLLHTSYFVLPVRLCNRVLYTPYILFCTPTFCYLQFSFFNICNIHILKVSAVDEWQSNGTCEDMTTYDSRNINILWAVTNVRVSYTLKSSVLAQALGRRYDWQSNLFLIPLVHPVAYAS